MAPTAAVRPGVSSQRPQLCPAVTPLPTLAAASQPRGQAQECCEADVLTFQQAEVRKRGSAFPSGCTGTYGNWLSPVIERGTLREETEPPGRQVFMAHWGSRQVCSVTFPLAAGRGHAHVTLIPLLCNTSCLPFLI